MRAFGFEQYGPPEVFREVSVPNIQPDPDEVLVKVHATSVNPLDWKLRSKKVKIKRPGFPQILGFDVCGTVAAAGAKADLAVGTEVYGMLSYSGDGANACYALCPSLYMRPKPPELTDEEAASLPMSGLTALQGLRLHGGIQKGEKVLIVGASGGVGTLAVQMAKAFGATVTATCSANNVELVRELGADEVIPYDQQEVPKGAGYDLVFDVVKAFDFGSASAFMAKHGRYVGTDRDPRNEARARVLRWLGGRRKCVSFYVQPDPQALDYMARLIANGALKPVLAHTYPITELAQAHTLSEGGHVVGKIAIQVAPYLDPDGTEEERPDVEGLLD